MNRHTYYYMNTAELLDSVFDLYKKSFWLQMARSMIFGIPALIALTVFIFVAAIVFGVQLAAAAPLSGSLFVFAALIIAGSLLWMSISLAGNISLAKQAFYGVNPSLSIMFKDIRTSLLRVYSALLAEVIIALPFLALIGLAVYSAVRLNGAGFDFLYDISIPFLILLTFILILILSLLALLFKTVTFAVVPAAMYEKKAFFLAVMRSVSLLKDDFFKTLGTFLIWTVVVTAVNYSFSILYYYISGSLSSLDMPAALGAGTVVLMLEYVFSILLSVVMSPFDGILSASVYFNQRIKKDGLDIEIELEHLRRAQKNGGR